ncbi:MAG: hypothetical protein ACKV0T_04400 [Planctomycetales bacterium]
MSMFGTLDVVPLWGLFGTIIAVTLLSIEAGYRLGRFRRRTCANEKEAPVGAIVAAKLGLLAFILAFTFGLAASRFDAKRTIVVDEANAIGTTYLRAGLLSESRGAAVRQLLSDYVDERLEGVHTGNLGQLMRRSDELHRALWKEAEAAGKADSGSIVVGLFIQSLNETIDLHAKRILVGLHNRVPSILWGALLLVTILTMAGVGYYDGLASSSRSPAMLVLALTFSIIIMLIADLDRSQEGLLTVSQQAMVDLQNMIRDHR